AQRSVRDAGGCQSIACGAAARLGQRGPNPAYQHGEPLWMGTMAIPVAPDKVGRPGEPNEAQNLATLLPIGPEQKARIRILVVDDEHTLRESCATVLRQEGYDVTVCARGQEAMDLLKRRAFDIV